MVDSIGIHCGTYHTNWQKELFSKLLLSTGTLFLDKMTETHTRVYKNKLQQQEKSGKYDII